MKETITLYLAAIAFALCLFVQTSTAQCPKISMTGPSDQIPAGEPMTFFANLTGGDPNVSVTYNWSVSAGAISSGQGTSMITVDTDGIGGQSVTATVEIGGLARSCYRTSSSTAEVKPTPKARLLDTFSGLTRKNENARLDNAVLEAQMDPSSTLYIAVFKGKKSRTGDVDAALVRVKGYVTTTRGLDMYRSKVMVGFDAPVLTIQLWLAPYGAAQPEPAFPLVPEKTPVNKKPKH